MRSFKAKIRKFDKGLWSYHILVPHDIYENLVKDGNKRIVCSINANDAFQEGFMPDGKGRWFIKLNKEKMKFFGLAIGQEVGVQLEKDESKYGMEIPREMVEVLAQDPEGSNFFEKLTPGKKRSLIYLIANVKSTDLKIVKSLIILDHLKVNDGNLDFRMLNQALKENKNIY
jgi:hypothetical protein